MPDLPTEVGGIHLPRSPAAVKAAQLARASCPPFLFNHCMRTFLFGAVAMEHQRATYSADDAFIAASLHDLGLLVPFETRNGSFELDGADRAVQLAREGGLGAADAEQIWWAIALHDARFAMAEHQGGTAMLVAMGAGSDVVGPDLDTIEAKRTAQIVAAFPRLQFKQRFTTLLIDHCHRKPLSQKGTWLEGLCREQSPDASERRRIERAIAAAPFSE
ncbi:MAG: hypothetical protein JO133_00125 [Burkholderiaceae bacterium]|nr:hypothetical protein [Burkholderiaceae bacterium]